MKSFARFSMAFVGILWFIGQAQGQLENHYTFDDPDKVTMDSSGNGRDGFLDDFDVEWVNDEDRGGVLEFGGNTAGFMVAEVPQLPGDNFTIMMWAYRDPDLAGGTGGDNDGLFQIQFATDDPEFLPPPSGNGGDKIIGGWVRKADSAVWGRLHDEDLAEYNLDTASFFMEDEEWTHFAYRGMGDTFEVVVNGESGEGPAVDHFGSVAEHDILYVGRQGGETWGGRLDDFRVYSKALTDEEIKEIMESGGGGMDLLGDFNMNGELDVADINLLAAEVRAGTNNADFDLDNNNLVDAEDHRVWVEDLKSTWFGDANLDLEFNSGDLVAVFTAGKYETGEAAGFDEGDWDADGLFASGDLVKAFQGAGYEIGPRPATAIPEPAAAVLWIVGLSLIALGRRGRSFD